MSDKSRPARALIFIGWIVLAGAIIIAVLNLVAEFATLLDWSWWSIPVGAVCGLVGLVLFIIYDFYIKRN